LSIEYLLVGEGHWHPGIPGLETLEIRDLGIALVCIKEILAADNVEGLASNH